MQRTVERARDAVARVSSPLAVVFCCHTPTSSWGFMRCQKERKRKRERKERGERRKRERKRRRRREVFFPLSLSIHSNSLLFSCDGAMPLRPLCPFRHSAAEQRDGLRSGPCWPNKTARNRLSTCPCRTSWKRFSGWAENFPQERISKRTRAQKIITKLNSALG